MQLLFLCKFEVTEGENLLFGQYFIYPKMMMIIDQMNFSTFSFLFQEIVV